MEKPYVSIRTYVLSRLVKQRARPPAPRVAARPPRAHASGHRRAPRLGRPTPRGGLGPPPRARRAPAARRASRVLGRLASLQPRARRLAPLQPRARRAPRLPRARLGPPPPARSAASRRCKRWPGARPRLRAPPRRTGRVE
ncbi:hypothetical protein GUJ93_ZPchr0008g12201 [Zizania palustris]|uniref:Uncharacterized protein n=1 Tax=Zizania palustris TaxID=103762 RepID=A0A8J5RIK6_ZIZPA|nr:hypothetical protein GUJ93_ZPchr0008g12201 [Zizania palustris]